MATRGRWLAAAALATTGILGMGAAHAGELPRVVVVDVQNGPQVPFHIREAAQKIATEVYASIGVQLVWESGGRGAEQPPGAERISVWMVAPMRSNLVTGNRLTLGLAVHQVRRAYVLCDRIEALSIRTKGSFATILGRVLAHEIGHLLLPGQGHAEFGIMRAHLDYRAGPTPRFTTEQAESIRSYLTTGPVFTARLTG